MRTYDQIFAIAAGRHGGPDALSEKIAAPVQDVTGIPEDRWLSRFTRMVFSAGFNWKVIEAKWEGFEEAFKGFDVDACAHMSDDWLDALLADTRIVRNGAKIASVQANAQFLSELRPDGGAGEVIGGWPPEDYVGLLDLLKSRGSRLGGTTAQYALRFIGKDSFILSADVVARLVAEGVVDKAPSSKKAMRAVQEAFNDWAGQSGRSLTEISRTLAMSV